MGNQFFSAVVAILVVLSKDYYQGFCQNNKFYNSNITTTTDIVTTETNIESSSSSSTSQVVKTSTQGIDFLKKNENNTWKNTKSSPTKTAANITLLTEALRTSSLTPANTTKYPTLMMTSSYPTDIFIPTTISLKILQSTDASTDKITSSSFSRIHKISNNIKSNVADNVYPTLASVNISSSSSSNSAILDIPYISKSATTEISIRNIDEAEKKNISMFKKIFSNSNNGLHNDRDEKIDILRTSIFPKINDTLKIFTKENDNLKNKKYINSSSSSLPATRQDDNVNTNLLNMTVEHNNGIIIPKKLLQNDFKMTSNVNSTIWPVKHASVVEGDVILGGLMMVHSREDSITCGPIMPQGGIQALEAMLYTLDRINEYHLLPNITLGVHILDDCDKDTYGLEMAVDFIKEFDEAFPNLKETVTELIKYPTKIKNDIFLTTTKPTDIIHINHINVKKDKRIVNNTKWKLNLTKTFVTKQHNQYQYNENKPLFLRWVDNTIIINNNNKQYRTIDDIDFNNGFFQNNNHHIKHRHHNYHKYSNNNHKHLINIENDNLSIRRNFTNNHNKEYEKIPTKQKRHNSRHNNEFEKHHHHNHHHHKQQYVHQYVQENSNQKLLYHHQQPEYDNDFIYQFNGHSQQNVHTNNKSKNKFNEKIYNHQKDNEHDDNAEENVDVLKLKRIRKKVFRSLPELDIHDQHYISHHWPVKREAVVEGDLILGGLMMVHSREDTIICGPIMPQGGIQSLEAMLYTIDRINEDKLLLPNITLGAHILDDCDKDSYGLEMAVDFIKGSISNIDDAEYHCNKTQIRKVISGVVGAASSVTSIQVANLLRLFRIPQVSFFSTSPELSNKQRFEYFSRTIPSDHYQVKAMVEIVKRMGWSYVSIIYEESNYGIKAYEELEELLAKNEICIAVKEKLVKDSGVAEEIAYDNIVQKLLTKPRARGAIIFGSDQEVREVMRAVRRNNATGAFSWIGSDGWSARNLVSDGNEPEVEGTLSVQPQANPVKGFEAYFLNLTVENNQRNPWFVEFWEDHFQCRYPNSFATPYNKKYNQTCTKKETLTRNNTDFEDQLQFVSDAVMAFAYALRDMHRDLCGGRPTLCDAMKPTKGADLLKYLRKVEFEGLSGDHFRFDINGDGPARYNIIHFKQIEAGKYRWVKVGEYYEGELRLNMTEVQFKLRDLKPPESVCSLPCERGQAKKYVEGERCCWHCFNCSMYQIRHPSDETQCIACEKGTLPDRMKEYCQEIPEVYLKPESAWAIGAMALSSTGILITLFVVGVFVKHNDTPVVRASGRELSYILLAGILMCYLVTFALVLKPTDVACGIQRFGAGFCFTVVYAALLTKTNRIARIFKAGKSSAKRPSFISPKSQMVICACLTFVQILINGVWMVISPSHAIHHYPTREDNLLVCDSYIDASYMIAFFYPIILIVVCTVYAILTRKIPEAFNESKHIGFTMYTTCVIWLAFVPLYFGTGNHVSLRITSMSVTISLSAYVTVACLFSPKLYIILIRPERNVRQSMMPARYSAINRASGTGPSSMMAAAMVTAATCNQEEKISKHISPSSTAENGKLKLCEMATQTVNISNIFTNIDSTGLVYGLPYVDQNVPNIIENNCQIGNNNKSNFQSPKNHTNDQQSKIFVDTSL